MIDKIESLLRENKSLTEIAKILNVKVSTVSYHLKKKKKNNKISSKYNWKEIQSYYDEGKTFTQCKEKFGFSAATWLYAIKNNFIKIKEKQKLPIEELLKNEKFHSSNSTIKKRVLEENLLENKCQICGLNSVWNGRPIILIMDHINGNSQDNRLENLRMLCPNCNSQTETFCKGHKKKRREKKKCIDCCAEISFMASRCRKCSIAKNKPYLKRSPKKIILSSAELEKLIWEKPIAAIAKELNVSDSALHKICKKLHIKKPNPGFWNKKH